MGTLLAALLSATLVSPTTRAATLDGSSVRLVVAERRETRVRGLHMVAAVGLRGDLVGALIDRRGRIRCTFVGTDDGRCLRVQGCVSGEACR